MKDKYSRSLIAAAAMALVAMSAPLHAAQTDSAIEASAKQTYVFKTYLKGDDVKVQSKDGVATLTGTVSDDSKKALAEDTVAALPDVKRVENKLGVKGDRPAEKSDLWLKTKVKSTLLFHRSVSVGTEVDVNDGVVTLRGEAASQAEKELTAEYAKDIEGVKDVKNEMSVAKAVKTSTTVGDAIEKAGDAVDDASVTALVKMTLLGHRSTSAIHTSVKTTDGVVTLTGKAANDAERALATKLVGDVNGVQSVDNQMTVI
ncbi:MAG: BON domain-containing protein [Proteobacteria bacterium]|nr:BON domain-containing protein [Pseudomonadota bacterium]